MAVETFPRSPQRSVLNRPLVLTGIHLEVVAYAVIILASLIAHLWNLGAMAMHHDEAIHAWTSWRFYTGSGDFECANNNRSATYCYDPVYHGPSLYILTLLSYFLFGDGDAQARLPMALAGVGMVASCWMLRPYLGRSGALIAAVLLGFSPSLLYFTRFARHDGLMVLWEVWMVISIFRYIDTGRPFYLYLLATSLALAIATHELYYILFFIFGIFLLVRLLAESGFVRRLNLVLLIVMGVCVLLMIFNRPLPFGQGLYLGEKAFLVGSTLLLAWLSIRVWDPRPVVIPRFQKLWYEERMVLWTAVSILVGIYVVLYTTFFAYPRGAIDGLYAGLAYWLGSQQAYARGDQPWYYYIMMLPLYEPLGVVSGIGAAMYLFTRRPPPVDHSAPETAIARGNERTCVHDGAAAADGERPDHHERHTPVTMQVPPGSTIAAKISPTQTLFPLLLVFWYFSATVIFSWAGEKMPWLLVHMSLPGNLVAAWALAHLIQHLDWRTLSGQRQAWLVPPAILLLFVALGVALWRLGGAGADQAGQINLLQGLVPLVLAGGIIYALLTIGQQVRVRVTLTLAGLTVACLLGAYMIRSSWRAVYRHPDTPIELLVYTQTAPDVPRYVQDVRRIAVNLTRNRRTADDVTGGLSMPIILDSGNSETGEGSLAWPIQWYLRDFQQLKWLPGDQFQNNPSLQAFEVDFADGSRGLAPVVMLHKSHVTAEVRQALREGYAQPYGEGGVFNWWFPEGDKCSPGSPGYKRFYYNFWTPPEDYLAPGPAGCGRDISAELHAPWSPFTWPFNPRNWDTLWNYTLYRQLPDPLRPGAREMEVWIRQDLVSGRDAMVPTDGVPSTALLRLVADQVIGDASQLTRPTGIAVDRRGNVYVADTQNHRIQVFDAQGNLIRSIGSLGSGEGQFYEPRGIAIDAQGNLYVADTWNARIVKLSANGTWLAAWGEGNEERDGRRFTDTGGTEEGNAASPLGLYGPRGVAVDAEGNVYIADTGNKRIVVTDDEGTFLYQLGFAGAEPGRFSEPTGVSVDDVGNLYVADTWNSRVQVFQRSHGTDRLRAIPIITWRVGGWSPNTYEDPSIAVSRDGRVYVSVPLQQRVVATNARGDVVLRWGGAGQDEASLNAPSGIAVGPQGEVYVVDRNTHRVLRFTLPQIRVGD